MDEEEILTELTKKYGAGFILEYVLPFYDGKITIDEILDEFPNDRISLEKIK